MGMKVQTPEQYEASLRKLFPRGAYWDRQFADPHSDCSLFCKAKLEEFIRFRNRMSDLQDESMPQSALETLEDWERVVAGSAVFGLDTGERRSLLMAEQQGCLNSDTIKTIGRAYGMEISKIEFPFRPAFFGFSRFGLDRAASPASFSAIYIHASIGQKTAYGLFEKHSRASRFAFSRFGRDRQMHPGLPAALHAYIEAEGGDSVYDLFKTKILNWLQANYIVYFIFGGS
jgi:uncharacterized protein YmfQ (DUF2313 family)